MKSAVTGRLLLVFLLVSMVFAVDYTRGQSTGTLSVDSEINISILLSEISGMAYDGDRIYAINDGGNGPYVFVINPVSGETIERYRIDNIRNKDWEEITVSGDHVYIGDFGNNRGNREDLVIYTIHKDSLSFKEPPVSVTSISYSEQKTFNKSRHDHEWDCEAMTVRDEKIYCFSKDWKNRQTKMYIAERGKNNMMEAVDSFDVGFLVTGAFFDEKDNSLFLCGYYDHETYLIHFMNTEEAGFSPVYTRYKIPDLENTQVESVLVLNDYIYLASERTLKAQAIYRIPVSSLDYYE